MILVARISRKVMGTIVMDCFLADFTNVRTSYVVDLGDTVHSVLVAATQGTMPMTFVTLEANNEGHVFRSWAILGLQAELDPCVFIIWIQSTSFMAIATAVQTMNGGVDDLFLSKGTSQHSWAQHSWI